LRETDIDMYTSSNVSAHLHIGSVMEYSVDGTL